MTRKKTPKQNKNYWQENIKRRRAKKWHTQREVFRTLWLELICECECECMKCLWLYSFDFFTWYLFFCILIFVCENFGDSFQKHPLKNNQNFNTSIEWLKKHIKFHTISQFLLSFSSLVCCYYHFSTLKILQLYFVNFAELVDIEKEKNKQKQNIMTEQIH